MRTPLAAMILTMLASAPGWPGHAAVGATSPSDKNPQSAPPPTTAAKLGPNTWLGDDPSALPPTLRGQAEPHLARSFTDPGLVVGIWQEGRFENGGALGCGYGISKDGGQTWRRGLIPHLTARIDGGPFDRASDPVAAIDSHDAIYLSTVALKGEAPNFFGTLTVSKSTDGGATFGDPLTAFSSTNLDYFPDKPWLAANSFPGTRTADRLVITFTLFSPTNMSGLEIGVYPIAITHSDDGGAHWSPARVISSHYCQGSQPMFLPDGSLAIVYWNFVGPTGNQIEVLLSADGGETFGSPRIVTGVNLYSDPIARAIGFLPSAACDRQAGVIYVTYQAWSPSPQGTAPRVMFTRSLDRGFTWSTPVGVNDTPGARAAFNPIIAASPDGQHLTIVFYDKRLDTGTGNIADFYLVESFDGGETWGPNLRLSTASSDLTLAPQTQMGRMLGDYHGVVPALSLDLPAVAIWIDTRTGSPDPFIIRMRRDRGTTFEAWRRLRFAGTDLATPAVSGEAADPDHDGLPNLLEYALALEPTRWDPDPVRGAAPSAGNEGSVSFSFEHSAVLSDIAFRWRASANLRDWSVVSPATAGTSAGATASSRRLTATFSTGVNPAQFFGLGAIRVQP